MSAEPGWAEDVLNDPINRAIWDLHHVQGLSVVATAENVGLSRSALHRRLNKIDQAVPGVSVEAVEARKLRHLARLDMLEAKLTTALQDATTQTRGEGSGVERVPADTLELQRLNNSLLRVLRERSKLLGLDAPKRIEIDGLQTKGIEWVFGEIEEGLDKAEAHANQGDDHD